MKNIKKFLIISKNGAGVGMLSVDGFTGQVWYHNWHGTFIEKIEY